MNWFKKLLPPKIKKEKKNGNGVPVGIWKKCDNCETYYIKLILLKTHMYVIHVTTIIDYLQETD